MRAIVISQKDPYQAELKTLDKADLPQGNVTVAVEHSTLNYKDGLAITGKGPVVRQFPMVPGIDFAGTVEQSEDARYQPGDKVILTGWGVGEAHWGGLAEFATVNGDWLVPMPESMTSWQSMAIGTAGFTAMLCVNALINQGVTPDDGPIVVTGANGGVGSVAVKILAQKGFEVAAVTGNEASHDTLKSFGATQILPRSAFSEPGKPLQKEQWAGAIDTAGSHTLANLCASMKYGGVVAATGLAQGMDFPATVAPFILRGVSLIGVDSVYQPYAARVKAWEALSDVLDDAFLRENTKDISLDEVIDHAESLMAGKSRGRVVVNI